MNKKYNIGLDIGTASCGIAVIGEDFNLIKVKGKKLWSTRLFSGGETAEQTRIHRTTRRRLARKKLRVKYLQELLQDEIIKTDKTFYYRLTDSFKHLEDRQNKTDKYNLFIEKDFNDQTYYAKYPTIYHLRDYLINTKEKADIRLIYLAIHHIIKYRGHFLYKGDFDVSSNKDVVIEKIYSFLNDNMGLIGDIPDKYIENAINGTVGKTTKYKKFTENTMKFILGKKIKPKEMFKEIEEINIEDEDIKKEICAKDEDILETLENIQILLPEYSEFFANMFSLYSIIRLEGILGDEKYLSKAMKNKYEQHKMELKTLKKLIKTYGSPKDYKDIFSDNGLYFLLTKKIKEKSGDAIKGIKKILENTGNDACIELSKKCVYGEYLSKLNTTDNSEIPYQLHKYELLKILENQRKHHKILDDNFDKIVLLLEFRIPYYVGPIGTEETFKSRFSWAIRNENSENEKVYPWNFNEVIDVKKSAQAFIERMTNFCTYLGEPYKVIPKNSLLYTKYMLFNEINRLRFNKKLLSNNEKFELIKDVFLKQNTVTKATLKKWYTKKTGKEDVLIEGFIGENGVSATLKPFRDFIDIYGDKLFDKNLETDKEQENLIEEIIKYITLFEDKDVLQEKLKELPIEPEKIKKMLKLNYIGFGALSKELLCDIKSVGENISIIDILTNRNLNFMQIINSKDYGFKKQIDEIRHKIDGEKITSKDVMTLYGSPAIKKGIWQAVKQVQAVIKLMGNNPENIFIEVAREDNESKRTKSRRKRLESLVCKEIKKDLDGFSDNDLQKESLYLYFTQNGKCMYSGKTLDYRSLDSTCEIDHIIPQSKLKDDSFDNKVLVLKGENQRKSDDTLSKHIYENRKEFWQKLQESKLITLKKLNKLLDAHNDVRDDEINSFINRQLVETRQITKHIQNLFNDVYKSTNVILVKSRLVDKYRKGNNIYKCRTINDMHHAKDAYIAGIIGMYINIRFPKIFEKEFMLGEYRKIMKDLTKAHKNNETNEKSKFDFVIGSMNKDYLNWDSKNLEKINKNLSHSDVLVTKETEIITGQMFDVTKIASKNLGGNIQSSLSKIPLKKGLDPLKYGYYKSMLFSHFALVEYYDKEVRNIKLVGIPFMYLQDNFSLNEYLTKLELEKCKNLNDKKLNNTEILIENEKIKYDTYNIDGFYYYIVHYIQKKAKSEELIKRLIRLDNEKSYDELYSYIQKIGKQNFLVLKNNNIKFKVIKDKIKKFQKIKIDTEEYYIISQKEWINAKQLKMDSKMQKIVYQIEKTGDKKDLNSENLNEIYEYLKQKIENEYKFESLSTSLTECLEKFKSLEKLEDKCSIILQMLNITKSNSSSCNLSLIGKGKETGRHTGKENYNYTETIFVYEDILGVNKAEVVY